LEGVSQIAGCKLLPLPEIQNGSESLAEANLSFRHVLDEITRLSSVTGEAYNLPLVLVKQQ
jgi:hypothetical protein